MDSKIKVNRGPLPEGHHLKGVSIVLGAPVQPSEGDLSEEEKAEALAFAKRQYKYRTNAGMRGGVKKSDPSRGCRG